MNTITKLFGRFSRKAKQDFDTSTLPDDALIDPHADEFFTHFNGQPYSFREFNELMAQSFAQRAGTDVKGQALSEETAAAQNG
jgi:hypothetical protein